MVDNDMVYCPNLLKTGGVNRIESKNMKIVEIVFETSNFDRSLTMPMKHEMPFKANKMTRTYLFEDIRQSGLMCSKLSATRGLYADCNQHQTISVEK